MFVSYIPNVGELHSLCFERFMCFDVLTYMLGVMELRIFAAERDASRMEELVRVFDDYAVIQDVRSMSHDVAKLLRYSEKTDRAEYMGRSDGPIE